MTQKSEGKSQSTQATSTTGKYVMADHSGKPLPLKPINVDKNGFGVYLGVIPPPKGWEPPKKASGR